MPRCKWTASFPSYRTERMLMSQIRLRRSELSTPGSSERMMEKAAHSSADVALLDLEDAVAPREKPAARAKVVEALTSLDWGDKTRAVRINDIETEFAYEDIVQVVEGARDALDLIVVPKVKSARDLWFVDTLLTQIETKQRSDKRIGLEVLIEEVEALINVEDIARCTPRLEAITFGSGDFSASQGMRIGVIGDADENPYHGDVWSYAQNKIVVAARAAGIDAIDGPYAAFNDLDGYRQASVRSSTLGFVGKWAIHPNQLEIANDVYSPAQDEVDQARRLATALAEAGTRGHGVVEIDGKMIDAASIRGLKNIIMRADLIGM